MFICIKMTIILSVEGNIGSGKSTLVKKLKDILPENILNHRVVYLQEPVDIWNTIKDENGQTVLERFYTDQEKWAFSFQMMAYISRISLIKREIEKDPDTIIITERSVWTDKNVFAKMLYDDNKIEYIDYQIYNKWFEEFVKDTPMNGIIYVNTEPKKCAERVNIRARQGEIVPLEYLQNCHSYHERWLDSSGSNILTLNGNTEFINDIPSEWRSEIYNFIYNIISPKKYINHDISMKEVIDALHC